MGRSVAATASALRVGVSLLARRLRQVDPGPGGELTQGQRSALARLERRGPTTGAALARLEGISPQSMGATLAALEAAGYVDRSADAQDARRVLMTVTKAGRRMLYDRRDARVKQLAAVLSGEFGAHELAVLAEAAPLLERLGQAL